MCETCGCGEVDSVTVLNLQTGREVVMEQRSDAAASGDPYEHVHADGTRHSHPHDHHHDHSHRPVPSGKRTIDVDVRVLGRNDTIAAGNRAWLAGREILA